MAVLENDLIPASQYLLFIDPAGGASFKVVGCLTDHQFTIANNVVDGKTMCGSFKTAGSQDFGLSGNGLLILKPDIAKVGHFDLLELTVDRTVFTWKIARATPTTDDVTITGSGFFSQYDSSHSAEAEGRFTFAIGISETPAIVEVV